MIQTHPTLWYVIGWPGRRVPTRPSFFFACSIYALKKKCVIANSICASLMGRSKILVKRNYTPGAKKIQKNFKFFFYLSPEFWYGHGKILVKKNYTPARRCVLPVYFPVDSLLCQ